MNLLLLASDFFTYEIQLFIDFQNVYFEPITIIVE